MKSEAPNTDTAPAQALEPTRPATPRGLAGEIGFIYLAALLLVLGVVLLGQVVPLVAQNLYLLVAAIFVGLPYWWLNRLDANFDDFGLTWHPTFRGILWGLLFSALTLLPFAFGYGWWQENILKNQFEFSLDNYYQWPLEVQGRPTTWDQARENRHADSEKTAAPEGVWIWADGAELHIGVASGSAPIELEIDSDSALQPTITGPARALHPSGAGPGHTTTIRLNRPNARSEIIFAPTATRAPPRDIKVRATRGDSGDPVAVFTGASSAEKTGPFEINRGLFWILLWALTQLVFIALPEEFFYRGYLLTRLRQFFDARRARRLDDADDAPEKPAARRRFLGVSAENALASALFALGHVLIPIGGVLLLTRASVFFPSLAFGWLRERTGSIVASVVFHAAANMMVLLAAPHFF